MTLLDAIDAARAGRTISLRCPGHDDRNASLSVLPPKEDGWVRLNCHAGCSRNQILDGACLTWKDLAPPKTSTNPANAARRICAEYDYRDEEGTLLFQAVRYDPKDFRQRRPDGNGGWIWNLNGVRKILFRLSDVLQAIADQRPVVITEGEKDALSLIPKGWQATCNPMGAGKWESGYTETLRGADVVVVPDNDPAGEKHLAVVTNALHGNVARLRVLRLPQAVNGSKVKDASDFFAAGGTIDQFQKLIDQAPDWTPAEEESKAPTETIPTENPAVTIAKELSGKRPDFAKIAGIVCDQLLSRGSFYRPIEAPSFKGALFFDRETKTLENIQADTFKQTVSDRFGINRAATCWKHVWAAVENLSIGPNSTPTEPEAFWAARPGSVYLSNGPGAIVRIRAEGVDLCDNGTDGVLFPRGQTIAPWMLTTPVDPFERCSLFRGLSTTAGHGPLLAKLWALSLPTCPANKPPLVMAGPIGSGKTRFVLGLLQLYGLDQAGRVLALDDNRESDFWPVLDAGGVLIADNADTKVQWLPDALAQAATGLGRAQRKLYTEKDLVAHRARSWIALTTARPEAFAGDPGLADRLLIVRMDRRRGETRDADLSREIAEARNAGLSWVAQTIATALADGTEAPPGLNQRHPDFARFAFRLGRALDREAEAVEALSAAEADKALFCIENDPVGVALLGFIADQVDFEGTARQLLEGLKERGQIEPESRLSPKGVGRKIEGLWPHIEKVFDADRTLLRTGTKQYRIKQKLPIATRQPIEPTDDSEPF